MRQADSLGARVHRRYLLARRDADTSSRCIVANDELRSRAGRIVAALEGRQLRLRVGDGRAQIGGGTLPRSVLPSVTIEVSHPTRGAQALAALLRSQPEPVIAYVGRGNLKLDLRTVFPHQDAAAIRALLAASAGNVLLMPYATHYIVATAGHVDHGKSALIKALTGTDPDRPPEEKARGITIDLGLRTSSCRHLHRDANPCRHRGCAGHEDFVKNMVAGVGAIDLALLIVAADDGWMPQTEEHLQILSYFGVRGAVVSLTKADLVGTKPPQSPRYASVWRAACSPTRLSFRPRSTGLGLDTLRAALARELSAASRPRDIGKPRLAVDRVFTLAGPARS